MTIANLAESNNGPDRIAILNLISSSPGHGFKRSGWL